MNRAEQKYRDNLERLSCFSGELIPLQSASEFLGVTPKQVRVSDLPLTKMGGRYYVAKSTLARWLQ